MTPEELEEKKQKRLKLFSLAVEKVNEKEATLSEDEIGLLMADMILPYLVEKWADELIFLEDMGGLKYIESNFTADEKDDVDPGWADYSLVQLMAFSLAIKVFEDRFPKQASKFFDLITKTKEGEDNESLQETTTS